MHRSFEDEFQSLQSELLYMASLVEQSLRKALQAITNRDKSLAKNVIASDSEVDEYEVKIENMCIELLARHTPVASDLRFVAATMKINNDLERIADHAANMAKLAIRLCNEPELKPLIDIPRMAELAKGMVKEALDSFIHRDSARAVEVCRKDDEVDALNRQIIRELITFMTSDPKTIPVSLDLIMVAKNLERVADLSTNIAEEVVFIVEARSIKHHLDDTSAQN